MNVELQVIGSALRAVAEEMGAVLIRSAFSANIKERRDCSTAIFDEAGRMVAQAEHIPVHLGAMPDAVAAAMTLGLSTGQVCILNDPYTGGTHLPDITLISRTSLGYAVSRAHHADVGGMEPASLPAFSRELYQEGLIIPPTLLTDEVERLFVANARNPDERRGDLRAQISAHRLAERRIDELCERRGRERVAAAMDELYAYSEHMVRAALARMPDGTWSAEDVVEAVDGELTIRATVEIAGDEIHIDFAGTDAQDSYNLNCPMSVTRSACYFVVRCLTEPDLPGVRRSVRARHGHRARGLPRARSPACGSRRGQHRDVVPHRRRALSRDRRPRAGTGNDEQRRARQRPLHVLRDDRRRPGRVRGRRRAVGHSRRDVERADHAGRGARALLSRCASSAGTCAQVPAEAASTAAETVSCASCACSRTAVSPCSPSAARTGPAASTAAKTAPAGRTLVNGEEQPAKVTKQLRAGDLIRIETPGGGGFG